MSASRSQSGVVVAGRTRKRAGIAYLCISDAELLMPRHNNNMMPVTATSRRNLVRVTRFHSIRAGGSWALAAFQFRPPLGRSMAGDWGAGRSSPPSGLVV